MMYVWELDNSKRNILNKKELYGKQIMTCFLENISKRKIIINKINFLHLFSKKFLADFPLNFER